MTNADVKIATVTIITEIAVFMGKELLIFLIKDTEDCSIHLPSVLSASVSPLTS